MKNILVIGMGRFGRHLAGKMQELGNTVTIVDRDEPSVETQNTKFKNMFVGDMTNSQVVEGLDVSRFDICFVAIGEDFESSLVVTSLLKSHGAKYVVCKAKRDIQSDLLRKIGADEIVYPEREIAEKLAVRFNSKNIFDYIPLTGEYSIYELPVVTEWVGQTLAGANVRRKYGVSIIAIKKQLKGKAEMVVTPPPDYEFEKGDHIVVIGSSSNAFKLASKT